MAVNLSKNGPALTAAYKEVVDEKSDTNWALFTYEGNSNDIRLVEKGDGGLEELVEELNSGKVMYAFCRVQDPNSGLPKYVLINWTGEGVKDARKGICANHVSAMANFLKGAHVTINARADEDVEPEAIMQKVAKASGANYSFHKEASNRFQDSGPQGPVGSVYQKTNAMSEIRKTNKDNFWAQAEKEEEKRRLEDRRKAEEERQKLERERKDRETKEAAQRDKRDKERSSQIDQQKKYQQQLEAESKEQEKQRWEEQQQQNDAAQRKAVRRGDSVEKANEAASLISQRAVNPREMFKQRERGVTPSDSDAPSAAPDSPQPGIAPAEASDGLLNLPQPTLHQRNTFLTCRQGVVGVTVHTRSFSSDCLVCLMVVLNSVSVTMSLPPLSLPPPCLLSHPFVDPCLGGCACFVCSGRLRSPFLSKQAYESERAGSPPRQASPSPVPAAVVRATEPDLNDDQATFEKDEQEQETPPQEERKEEAPAANSYVEETPYEEPAQVDESNNYEMTVEETSDRGICARALYDYQAADDTEISFDPDDVITGIEMIDEGWWRGFGPDGHFGMFPANYVELM
ncbi:PREDICTED: drebrin-like protein isoform X2 [Poecilia mexicana]|uniref:drebrin-like protein isoform X2 n=1 Tax=Poecilia mexicana TaxID=48701 RepID=UPI00072E4134|nr:PREDICTED: drebrin-like protein isoform X2 [Poecilia mexicana]